jgi:hypothetical protein
MDIFLLHHCVDLVNFVAGICCVGWENFPFVHIIPQHYPSVIPEEDFDFPVISWPFTLRELIEAGFTRHSLILSDWCMMAYFL